MCVSLFLFYFLVFQTNFDIKDKYRRLKRRSIRKLITLPPKYLGNLNKGINETILKSTEEIYKE
jgi:hypothetical protein